jgi:hypothetical protein
MSIKKRTAQGKKGAKFILQLSNFPQTLNLTFNPKTCQKKNIQPQEKKNAMFENTERRES